MAPLAGDTRLADIDAGRRVLVTPTPRVNRVQFVTRPDERLAGAGIISATCLGMSPALLTTEACRAPFDMPTAKLFRPNLCLAHRPLNRSMAVVCRSSL